MSALQAAGVIACGPDALEYRITGPYPEEAPTIVLLHEGLGSADLWGSFPERLWEATGLGVFAYSRAGYGNSSPASLPRPVSYMHEEALVVLPALLNSIAFRSGVLLGHSDGASIAAIYAGSVPDDRVRGLSLIAPHFIIEDETLAGIADARQAYEQGDLRAKLASWHRDVDGAFHGWNDAWLDPAFRAWDITACLPEIRVPMQLMQGTADRYGTLRQLDIAEAACRCPVETYVLEGVGHAPHREAPEETLRRCAPFILRALERDRAVGRRC